MAAVANSLTIRRIAFRNFKGLGDYSVSLDDVNVLCGPNNSGKSTIIGSFRALAAGIRTASARLPTRVGGPFGLSHGYWLPTEVIPISLENAHTDLSDEAATVTFALSNGNFLHLWFPMDGGCALLAQLGDTPVSPRDTATFRRLFEIKLGVVPVLGPVEHNEELVEERTVERNIATHRASRNFRSYWRRHEPEFEEFRQLLVSTWPGMDIQFPEMADLNKSTLAMFCLEDRMTREIYWAGFGFQIWCQLLTHIVRSKDCDLFVVDEPETYLHPDLQRRAFRLISGLGPQIVVATHSTEILSEAEPSGILLVDRSQRSAKRLTSKQGAQPALDALGSSRNLQLTSIARYERVVFFEGDDTRIFGRLIPKVAPEGLATPVLFAAVPLGGHRPKEARAIARGIRDALGERILFGIALDRDYRSPEEIEDLVRYLRDGFDFVHIHARKEIENYLLQPGTLGRLIERERRKANSDSIVSFDVPGVLEQIAESLRIDTQAQVVEAAIEWERRRGSGIDRTTAHRTAVARLEADWPARKLELVAGKSALARLNDRIQNEFGISISPGGIVDELRADEMAVDLRTLLRRLAGFRRPDATE
ncbi:MAG: AAA family ATPase [Dehalococcoidia bacterium]|jgi:energy-coupling factor transporter ATP-binding protein EcfA2